MMRIGILPFLPLLTLLATSCGVRGGYVPAPGAERVDPVSLFSVGQVTDATGFEFPPGEEPPLVLEEAMAEALTRALEERGALGSGRWIVEATLVEYAPGNAFQRWLLPVVIGKTRLGIEARVIDRLHGVEAARIPAERTIRAGGIFTVGAWRYVFDEVAREIVSYLLDPHRRGEE
ncbi:MAG: DUF4410 domain-containing protein [Deltaproteobacteria bacterium]|jgi:hypothetical protein|nr:DUF4410 domain-containing protein [Deltaproteobacteria bacterium]